MKIENVEIMKNLGQPNLNGRIYTKENLEHSISCKKVGYVGVKTIYNLVDVSHFISDLRFEGDSLFGTVTILDTPQGTLLKEIISHPSYGFRPSGVGSVRENGDVYDYVMTSIDFVRNPA